MLDEMVQKDHPGEEASVLSSELEANLETLRAILGESADLVIRRFNLQASQGELAALVYIDGLTDVNTINQSVLDPLMSPPPKGNGNSNSVIAKVESTVLHAAGVAKVQKQAELVDAVLAGAVALLIERQATALLISAQGWEKRAIQEPETEVILKGPREGFTENLRTNTALLRRRIGNPALTFEKMTVGQKTRTQLNIAYLKGVTPDKLVEEVRRRIRRINTDAILAEGFIEQFIEDAPFSPFSTVGYTERPDVCAARVLEGRVAIITDGTPVVGTVPFLFVESFQSPDDYNFRWIYSSAVRWFRYFAFLISILLPAIYVALSSFHQELIPTPLYITMAAANEGTPFPALVEVLGMGLTFEILREAGIRLPKPLGQAVSIVGALVIGQTTVAAGLVGAPVVIVIGFTAVTSFAAPTQTDAATLLRLGLTVLAGMLGAYGILSGLLLVFIHLAGLRSFGVPYLAPVAPLIPADLKDVAVRAPLWAMLVRPQSLFQQDPQRQAFRLLPHPPEEGEEEG